MAVAQRHFLVNGRFLQRPVTGVERFATELLLALDQMIGRGQSQGMTFSLVVPPGTQAKVAFKHIPVREIGRHQGHVWEQLDLPLHCQGQFLLNLCNTGPVLKRAQMVVVHDAAVFSMPQAYGTAFVMVYRLMHRLLARNAQVLATVSEFSRKELTQALRVRSKPLPVLPEGGEHVLRTAPDSAILTKAGLQARPYVLAVSSAQANKNFAFVAKALGSLGDPGFDVVVAGGSNHAVFSSDQQSMPGFIKRVGYVTDEELACLYKHAACFVFPSLYEGFGIPPLEAMAHGCPVVASHSASIPEVCGDAALYFDPVDADSFLTTLMRVMNDSALRDQLRRQAILRSQQWTWPHAAQALLSVLSNQSGSAQ